MITKENIIHTVSLIEATKDNVISRGTGFFYSYEENKIKNYLLISNKHIMSECDNFKFSIPILDEHNDTKIITYTINIQPTLHPEYDLAAIGINSIVQDANNKNYTLCIKYIESNDIVSNQININSIETVYISGYPEALVGDSLKHPITKKGITATSLSSRFNNREEFLTDIVTTNGYSGSPVFLEKEDRLLLAGIHYATLNKDSVSIGLGVTINYKIIRNFLLA